MERRGRGDRSGRQHQDDDCKDTKGGREDGVFPRTSCGPEEEEQVDQKESDEGSVLPDVGRVSEM